MFRIALKSFSYLASATMVLLASGFLTLRPVHHLPNVPTANASGVVVGCSDIIQLPGQPLTPVFGNGDGGQMNFDGPGAAWQACGEEKTRGAPGDVLPGRTFDYGNGPITVNGVHFLKGWIWNTNFGDISTSCEGGFNSNIACGAKEYGAYMIKDNNNNDSARIMGFSWNDKMGWVKMGCEGGLNTGVGCDAIPYGASVALRDGVVDESCPNLMRGDMYGFVFTDSLGYLNVCGTHMDLTNMNDLGVGNIVATVSVDPNGPLNPADGRAAADFDTVYPNGVVVGGVITGDFYEIDVRITENGVPLGGAANPARAIAITPPQITNTVKTNQVTGAGNAANFTPFVYEPARQLYKAYVYSVAPTDANNQFIFGDFTVQVTNPLRANELISTQIMSPNANLAFTQPVAVTHIAGKDGRGVVLTDESFQLSADQSTPLAVRAVKKTMAATPNMPADGAINITTQLYSCTAAFDFIFDAVPLAGNNKITLADGSTEDTAFTTNPAQAAGPYDAFKAGVCSVGGRIIDSLTKPLTSFPVASNSDSTMQVFAKTVDVAPNADAVNALALQTVVSYPMGAQTISYYSRSLQDGAANSQAAKIDGNVNLSTVAKEGLEASYQNWISDAVGDNTQSNREMYLRAARAVLGNKVPAAFGVPNRFGGGEIVGGEIKILRTAEMTPGVLYYKHNPINGQHPCAIIITQDTANAAVPVTVNQPTTLVTEGCNIFIDRDVVATKNAQGAQVGNLGIIALADYRLSGANAGAKGGNVYVCNWATDIEANIVAEGSLYGTATVSQDCGTTFLDRRRAMLNVDGSPTAASMQRTLLNRQLTIYGSLLSNNTYGGSVKPAPNGPLLGDGQIARTPAQLQLSRAQDLNFIRYGKIVTTDLGPDYGEHKCWANDFVMSKLITIPPDQTPAESCADQDNYPNTPEYTGTFNLKYRAPMSTQPIFSGL